MKTFFTITLHSFLCLHLMGQACSGDGTLQTATLNIANGTADNVESSNTGNTTASTTIPTGSVVGLSISLTSNTAGTGGNCNNNNACNQLRFNISSGSGGYVWTPYSATNNGDCGSASTTGIIDLNPLSQIFTSDGILNVKAYDNTPQNCVDHTFAGFSVTVYVCPLGQVLPVKIKELHAYPHKDHVTIRWTTSSEINNKWQIVERSGNGADNWTEVDRVGGSQGSDGIRAYEVLDLDPILLSYYRIKSVDFDGTVEYSRVIFADRTGYITNQPKMIYTLLPNPATDYINVLLDMVSDATVRYSVLDMNGKVWISDEIFYTEGNNALVVPVRSLLSGMYLLRLQSSDNLEIRRFFKS
jgi:hypothetical protein